MFDKLKRVCSTTLRAPRRKSCQAKSDGKRYYVITTKGGEGRKLPQNPSVAHPWMVQLIKRIEEDGFTITHAVGIDGYPRPTSIGGRKPDIIGKDDTGLKAIGLCKSAEELSANYTKQQLYLFAHQAMLQSKKMVPFYLAVPTGYESHLEEALEELGIAKFDNVVRVYVDCSQLD